MDALLEEDQEEFLEPESTAKSRVDSDKDGQKDNKKGQGEEETDGQTIQGEAVLTDTDHQADPTASDATLSRITDSVDLRASSNANVVSHGAIDQIDQGLSEQMDKKAASQAGYVESVQIYSQMSALLDERPEQTERKLSNMVEREASKEDDQVAEQKDHRIIHLPEERFSEQFDSRLSGLVQQKASGLTDIKLSNLDLHTIFAKKEDKLHELVTQLTEQAADKSFTRLDEFLGHKADDSQSKEHEPLMDIQDDYRIGLLSGYGLTDHLANKSSTRFKNLVEIQQLDSCTFEPSQMNLKTSNVSVSNETDTQSTARLKTLESFESRFFGGFQARDQSFPQLFPSILTRYDHITSQEKTEATEIKSGDDSESQQGVATHEYPQVTGRRFPPIVYEDPYQVSLQYMEKHNILQIFQKITENLVYEKPEDPLRFMLCQIQEMMKNREKTENNNE